MKDTLTKGKSIHDELVPGLPVTRKERATPNTAPDILRGDSQVGDGTVSPNQGRGDTVSTIKIASCVSSGQLANWNVSRHKVIEQIAKRGNDGERKRVRTNKMDKLSFEA